VHGNSLATSDRPMHPDEYNPLLLSSSLFEHVDTTLVGRQGHSHACLSEAFEGTE
jgi:hypothetical protein